MLQGDWGRVTTKCWKGTFQALLSWTFEVSITCCRKFLSLIPALFLFVWMSVRSPLTLICLNVLRTTTRSRTGSHLTLIMLISEGKQHHCGVYFLFPALDLWKKRNHCFQLLSQFYLSLRGSLTPLRLIDVSIAYGDESLTSIENNMMKWDLRLDTVGCNSALDTLVIIHI